MDSESVTMETDDDESSFDEEEDEEYEPKQEVWVQSASGAKRYKPVHLNVSYQMDAGSSQAQQAKKNKGNDPSALAVLRRLSPELQHGYRILIDLMGDRCKSFAWPFMEKVDPVLLKLPDYYDRIKTPMWLTKIESKFENLEYTSISEFVSDIRQIFENCYRYNGLKHLISRQASTLECHFEQKLSQLSKHVRDKTHFQWTMSPQNPEVDTATSSMFGRRVSQRVLENKTTMTPVADYMVKQLEREEEERRKQRIIERKAELERLNKRLLEWEKEELLVEPLASQLKSMWEIPAIGQFLKLCCENMYLQEFSLFELERALVLPQSSRLLARIFTNVLTTRYNRKRVSKKPPMPYELWVDKLRKKLDIWYAFLNVESATRESVARHLYIPIRFFEVLGDVNPLTGRDFHDLSIYERVWVLKGMCDHLFETDYDVWFGVDVSLIEDQRAVVLGEDDEKASYLYFPHFLTTDLRIYRQAQIKEEKTKKKKEKAEKSPSKKSKKEAKTETPSQDSDAPKKRGRPRKNAETGDSTPAKTPVKTPVSSKSKETGIATPSQSASGVKPGRGRPRKDGTTPVQALKKKPAAKPTAVVTPTRRSSRRSARFEKPEFDEHDGEEQEKGNEDTEEGLVKENQCDRTKVADEAATADGTVTADGAETAKTPSATETLSADEPVSAAPTVCVDSPVRTGSLETDIGQKHLESKSAENIADSDEGRTSGQGGSPNEPEGSSPSELKGGSPMEAKGKSPLGHALCNGVMDVCEADASTQQHSTDGVNSTEDNTQHSSISECDQSKEEATNVDNLPASAEIPNSNDKASNIESPLKESNAMENSHSPLNQNQSNTVMDNVSQPGAEVTDMDLSCSSKLTGKEVEHDRSASLDNHNSLQSKEDGTNECAMEVDGEANNAAQEDGNPTVKTELTEYTLCIKEEQTDAEPEMIIPKEEAKDETAVEPNIEAKPEGDLNQESDMTQDKGEEEEVVVRAPTPPPQPLPGLLPPEGEFKLVCDSVESFRALIEKFAQKEETITKGRKTIVQPIKRSGRTTELHKTLSRMLEDLEPIEAKLQKVVHKAREVVYTDYEKYNKDPSPSKDAVEFWYQLHVKKPVPAVETSSAEVSSVDDDFYSSESSDSDKLSEEEDSDDDDDTAEYDDTCSEYSASIAPSDVATGGELNGEGSEARGEKIDLYSGVEIAGRHMRSSKRRRAQQREVIKDRKKAKRSKIQIVKGAPLRGRYAKPQEKETEETKLKKVHEELKENLKAGSTFQMTKNIIPGAVQKTFEPYKQSALPSKKVAKSSGKETSPAYQRDTSDKFIRILKRKAGTTEPAPVAPVSKPTKTSPREPTLKVPFLEKSKSVQDAAEAAASDKKMKTETFSFTIDAKVWESLKDKPEERQKMIVQHVEKMRVAGGSKKEPTPKVQNSRQAPWFSRSTNATSLPSRSGDASESPDRRVSASQKIAGSPGLQTKTVPGLQESMPVLDPVGTQQGALLQNPNMPALAPVIQQKVVLGNPGGIALQQAHPQVIQLPGNQSTAIASSGNSGIVSGGITSKLPGGTFDAKGSIVSVNVPGLASPPSTQGAASLQDVSRLVQSVAAQQPATGTDAPKTIVLPTNLKVNMNNKQYKILYVQKPGAPKPELCLQLCTADGSPVGDAGALQGAVPLVSMQQSIPAAVPAASTGRNMHVQMVPQGGNKMVMQAVPHQPKPVQNVAPQNPLTAQTVVIQPQAVTKSPLRGARVVPNAPVASVINPAAGNNTSVVTMISTPIPPVRPVQHAISTHTPLVGMQSQASSSSLVSSVKVAPALSQVIAPQGTTGSAGTVANQIVQLLTPSAMAPSVAPSLDSAVLQPIVSPTAQPTGAPLGQPMVSPVVQPIVSPVGQPIVSPVRHLVSVPSDLQTNVILQAASASGLVLSPEPTMKQIVVQDMPQGN